MMLEREQRVEAERLRQVAQRHVLGQHRGVRASFLREHVQRDADFHGDLQGIAFGIRYGPNYTPSGPAVLRLGALPMSCRSGPGVSTSSSRYGGVRRAERRLFRRARNMVRQT